MNQSGVKIFLAFVYAVLIAILLMMRGCDGEVPTDEYDEPAPAVEEQPEEAEPLTEEEAMEEAENIGRDGDLKVTLMWNFYSDIDLHVIQPNGKEINYTRKRDRSTGGELDVDNRVGGRGAAENIYYENPMSGKYTVYLVYYSGSVPEGASDEDCTCTVVIKNRGEQKVYKQVMRQQDEERKITDIIIP